MNGLLWSLYRPVAWLPGRPVRATCMTAQPAGAFSLISPPGHPAPFMGCRCGLYAAFWRPEDSNRCSDADEGLPALLGLPDALERGLVLGEVAGWGRAELYTRGYRSEWAGIRAIYATSETAGEVADAYDVPLVAL